MQRLLLCWGVDIVQAPTDKLVLTLALAQMVLLEIEILP